MTYIYNSFGVGNWLQLNPVGAVAEAWVKAQCTEVLGWNYWLTITDGTERMKLRLGTMRFLGSGQFASSSMRCCASRLMPSGGALAHHHHLYTGLEAGLVRLCGALLLQQDSIV